MKVKQYQTSVTLDKENLTDEQKRIRQGNYINSKLTIKLCPCCMKDKILPEFRIRKTRRGVKGKWVDRKCKDCHARTRGTKEIGKLHFAKHILNKGFRRCTVCKDIKPLSEFYKNKAHNNGIDHTCMMCDKKRKENNKTNRLK